MPARCGFRSHRRNRQPAYKHDTRHRQAVADIRAACTKAGIVPGIHCVSAEMAHRRIAEGFQMVTVGNDAALMQSGARTTLSLVRDGPVDTSR